jgi:two-component system phosphate regulon sensor histidine kinase PhoR
MDKDTQIFENLSRLIDAALVTTDASGVVIRANEAALDLLGQHITANPLEAFIRHPDLARAIQQALDDGTQTDLEYTRMDQVKRQFQVRIAPLDGEHVVAVIRNSSLAPTLERVQSEFVANVSHELRSPLSSLNGFIETLMGPAADDAEAHERFLPIMQSEAYRMERLIDGLLSLSRFEVEAHRPPRDKINLLTIMNQVIASKQGQSDQQNITISVTSEWDSADTLPLIIGDGDEIAEVFHNLLENATRYGDRQHPIEVTLSREMTIDGQPRSDALRVQIINQGDTIEARHIPRLTERFYRIDEGRARAMGGSGLGLAIVNQILNRHKARMRITSENRHTCVAIAFPTAS